MYVSVDCIYIIFCYKQVVGIVDPDECRAQKILQRKLEGPHASLYTDCATFSTYLDALEKINVDVAFIGMSIAVSCTY